jgi:hypothetical protein
MVTVAFERAPDRIENSLINTYMAFKQADLVQLRLLNSAVSCGGAFCAMCLYILRE